MKNKLLIPILLGTNRKDRQSEKVANYLFKIVKQRDDVDTELFDVKDFKLPYDNYGQDLKDMFPRWKEVMQKADGLIIVSPEYNHGYPGPLKSVLDLLLKEYVHKAVGLVGVSAGPFGGTRVIQQLVQIVRELGLVAIFNDLYFPMVQNLFDENNEIKDKEYNKRVDAFLRELIWIAKALKYARESIK